MSADGHTGRLRGARIAVDARYARRPGMGINRYLQQVLRLLSEAGADVTLIANFPPAEDYEPLTANGWISVDNDVHLFWEQVCVPRILAEHAFDLYWAPGNSGIPLRRVAGTKYVWTLHDLVPLKLARMYLKRPLYAGPYLLHTAAGLRSSDLIFTVSNASARDIKQIGRRATHVAPSIFFPEVIEPAAREARSSGSTRLVERDRYLVYNGGLDARKNVPVMLEGFARAHLKDPGLSLVLMGKGYEVLAPLYESLGIRDAVVLSGYVSESEKFAILADAHAVLYMSLYEGFGIPILEAFASGVPVVTAANSSMLEVADRAGIFADPADADSIAVAIGQLGAPEVRTSYAEAGRRRLEEYDWAGVREGVVAQLEALLSR